MAAPRYVFRNPSRPIFFQAPIAEALALDPSNPKWIQLCTAGSYVYHGEPIEITPATFDEMIANFHAHPSFDPAGRALFGKPSAEVAPLVLGGKYGVIALNFDHPPQGAPRPGHGWFLDVERRGSTLWGLCFFDDEAHAGMLKGTWKWTSIEWSAGTVSPKGERIGAYLSGVALTNDPFIQGMAPIQMSRPGIAPTAPTLEDLLAMLDERDRAYVAALPPEQVATDPRAQRVLDAARAKAATMARGGPVVFFGPATDVLCDLRGLFALPETADVGAVIGELAKLRAWALGEMAPPLGVDVGDLVSDLRGLLNLPTLSDPATIFAELDKLLARLAAETPEDPMPDPIKTPDPNSGAALGLARLLSTFSTKLSAKLGRAVPDDEQSVILAFDAHSAKFDEAMGHVNALKATFGTDDAKAIAEKLAALMQLGDQMTALLGEVAAEHEAEEKAEGEMAASDVAQVMAAQRLDPRVATGTVQAYTAQRLGNTQKLTPPTAAQISKDPASAGRYVAAVRLRREERSKARETFLGAHGLADFERVKAALPMHLQGAFAPALFGAGGVFAPAQQPQQGQPAGAPMAFSQGQQPAGQYQWSRERVAALPPGNNDAERIFAEVVRTEFDGKAPPGSQAYDRAWSRVMQIQTSITQQAF